jgi:histidinol-phosphate aminotransferase
MQGRTVTQLSRRSLLQTSGLALAKTLLARPAGAVPAEEDAGVLHLNLNENAYGPSRSVAVAIQAELRHIYRYADAHAADAFREQIAAYERVPVEQVVLGEILGALGLYLGSLGGPGGEFIYSTPGYLALVDAASRVGGVGVPVPLDKTYSNDLPALAARVSSKTRALYLINPHNPTGTVSDDDVFKSFLRKMSHHAPVIVDEAYLEYVPGFERRSAVSLVRDGANVLLFRTFDKIHGLAGLPIGYSIVPRGIADALRKQGVGDPESLGRLNIAAASAALRDRAHVQQVRDAVSAERQAWHGVLDNLRLPHTHSVASFVFFNAGQPQPTIAAAFRSRGTEVGRAFPPYDDWVRITIGRPEQNQVVQQQLREILRASTHI